MVRMGQRFVAVRGGSNGDRREQIELHVMQLVDGDVAEKVTNSASARSLT